VAREVEPSLNIRLLADLRIVFGAEEQLTTKKILAELYLLEDAPWNDLKGKPLSDNQLARRLKQYGVKSRNLRIGDAVPKGYARADLYDVWRRYLPPLSDKPATPATPATSQSFQEDSVVAKGATEPLHDAPEPLQGDTDVAPVADDVEACSASTDARNADEMGFVASVAAVAPLRGNGEEEPGLSRRRIRELADWYQDQGHQRHNDGTLDTAELDADLRLILREEVAFPEHVEIEFERVMRTVFR
jgi:hypothetical protein